MTHTYEITGMTCTGCEAKVKSALLSVPDVTSVELSHETNSATISMEGHVPLAALQKAVHEAGSKYNLSAPNHSEVAEQTRSFLATYKPLILVFAFITGISLAGAWRDGAIHWMAWMQYFMAGFFLAFSFFKLLDLKGFADSYRTYDLLAKRVPVYGFVYPFIELGLGVAYLTGFDPFVTNITTIAVMGFSSIGPFRSVLNKRQIQCACLGTVFNLPMSTVTIIEDLLMVAMAAAMLILM